LSLGFLPKKFPVYPDLLEKSRLHHRQTARGGDRAISRRVASREILPGLFETFAGFWKAVPAGKPFCFWFGSHDPHRPYEAGSGAGIGLKTDHVVVPPIWPDNEVSRTMC